MFPVSTNINDTKNHSLREAGNLCSGNTDSTDIELRKDERNLLPSFQQDADSLKKAYDVLSKLLCENGALCSVFFKPSTTLAQRRFIDFFLANLNDVKLIAGDKVVDVTSVERLNESTPSDVVEYFEGFSSNISLPSEFCFWKHQPNEQSTEGSVSPTTLSQFEKITTEEEHIETLEKSTIPEVRVYKQICFNCNGEGHRASECKMPRDAETFSRNMKAFNESKKSNTPMSDVRYYDGTQPKRENEKTERSVIHDNSVAPIRFNGTFSADLLNALNNQQSSLTSAMFRCGYPPGYVDEAFGDPNSEDENITMGEDFTQKKQSLHRFRDLQVFNGIHFTHYYALPESVEDIAKAQIALERQYSQSFGNITVKSEVPKSEPLLAENTNKKERVSLFTQKGQSGWDIPPKNEVGNEEQISEQKSEKNETIPQPALEEVVFEGSETEEGEVTFQENPIEENEETLPPSTSTEEVTTATEETNSTESSSEPPVGLWSLLRGFVAEARALKATKDEPDIQND